MIKGRGARSNPTNRFHDYHVLAEIAPETDPRTVVRAQKARSLIASNRSPDVPFERSINPYMGCEHGCVYCYARPSHAYLDLSAGIDFETKIFAKTNAVTVLESELRHPGYRCRVIAIGGNTDAYQPAERQLEITRGILSLCRQFRQPIVVITKSTLIERDMDILAPMAAQGLASVAVSVTSLHASLKRTLEPRAASPAARLRTIEALTDAGIPVTVLVAPVIPKITDHELEAILDAARQRGARAAAYILLRLPLEVRDLFVDWLRTHYPQRAAAAMSLMRQYRGGADYVARFGERMRGVGPYAQLLAQRFERACRKLGLRVRSEQDLDVTRFEVPAKIGDQLRLFCD